MLAQYETVDCGKPIVEAEADMVSYLVEGVHCRKALDAIASWH